MEPPLLLEYVTQNFSRQSDVGDSVEEFLLKQAVFYSVKSEYKFFCAGFSLKIPYDVMMSILASTKKSLEHSATLTQPVDVSVFIQEAGLRLLRLARNCYYRKGIWSHLRHFYRVVIPNTLVVPPEYFKLVAENLFKSNKERLNVGKYMTIRLQDVWKHEDVHFQNLLFHTLTRVVAFDYIHYANDRRHFAPDEQPVHSIYVHHVTEMDTLSECFRCVGIVNGFFIHLGLVEGLSHLDSLVEKYHASLYTPSLIKEPLPVPDMRMLMFHSAMEMIRVKYNDEYWKFALWFKINYMQDIRRAQIRGLIKSLPIFQRRLREFHYKFIDKMVGTPTKYHPTRRYYEDGEGAEPHDDMYTLYNKVLEDVKIDNYYRDDRGRYRHNILHPCVPASRSCMKAMFTPIIFSWSPHKCYF